jgi:hypothetical protein
MTSLSSGIPLSWKDASLTPYVASSPLRSISLERLHHSQLMIGNLMGPRVGRGNKASFNTAGYPFVERYPQVER